MAFFEEEKTEQRVRLSVFFLSKSSCTVVSLEKQLATTPVSHHAGKALLEAVVKAALLSCYTQLFCAFFKPIYRPAAEAFLATRLLLLRNSVARLV